MRKKIEAIQSLLAAAKEENEFGGSEDAEGCLHPGDVDFDELEKRIICVLKDQEYIPTKRETLPHTRIDMIHRYVKSSVGWIDVMSENLDKE